MHQVAQVHQKRIARQTLKMSLAGARIAGGMSYAQAYRIIFRVRLQDRMRELMAHYPINPGWLSWELDQYGYSWSDFPALLEEGMRENEGTF